MRVIETPLVFPIAALQFPVVMRGTRSNQSVSNGSDALPTHMVPLPSPPCSTLLAASPVTVYPHNVRISAPASTLTLHQLRIAAAHVPKHLRLLH